jgi:cell division septation protein DedD
VRRANPAEGQCLVIIKKEGYRQENLMVSIASSLQAQNLEVALKKENDIYLGMVVNASNNLGLGDVVIRVTNQNNGKSINIAADALGKFALALNPQTSYLLRFSKAGFVEVNQPIKTGDNSTRNQLSTIRMMPLSGAPAMVEATPKPADELVSRSTEEPATSAPESKSRSATPVKPPPPAVPASVPVAAPKPPATTAKSGEGFAVQVVSVSVSSGGATINDVLTKLEGLGSVYLVHEGPFEKIRIGNFSTEAEAIAIAQKVKERGYTGAYIVRENMVKETSPAMPTKVSASKPATSSQYFIRLASYKDTRWFDASKVKGLGTLEQRKKGEYTIMLLSGLGSLDDARKTLSKVKNSGFTDAQLVQDVNGELKKVEF